MLNRIRLRILRRFRREERGLAAVEFALILPVLITMLFGMGELSLAVGARSAISQVASTVGDLVAQSDAPDTTDIRNVYAAANTILYPYYPQLSGERPTIRITSVIYDTVTRSRTAGRVAWSCTQAGSGALSPGNRTAGSTVSFGDNELLTEGGSVLMAEVAYRYSSPTTRVLTGGITMTDRFQTKPRRVAQIPAPNCP